MQAHNYLSTAILVFANSSKEELQHKPFAKKEALFDALTERTLLTVKKTQIPFYHLTEAQQHGDSFGERFTNAIQSIFDKGYDKVITVGNDSPNLEKAHLEKALFKLDQNESVIGPSADGGFYLLGLHRSNFEKTVFENLAWQTDQINNEVVDILNVSGRTTYLLPTLFDIDTYWDAKTIFDYSYHLEHSVLKAILAFIPKIRKLEVPPLQIVELTAAKIHFNKGSPIYISS